MDCRVICTNHFISDRQHGNGDLIDVFYKLKIGGLDNIRLSNNR